MSNRLRWRSKISCTNAICIRFLILIYSWWINNLLVHLINIAICWELLTMILLLLQQAAGKVKIYLFFLRYIFIFKFAKQDLYSYTQTIKYNNNFEQSAGNQIYIFYILPKAGDTFLKNLIVVYLKYNNITDSILVKFIIYICYKLFILFIINFLRWL